MPIRVLHLIKGLGPGGAEQLIVNQARATDSEELVFHAAYLVPWKSHLVPGLQDAGWQTTCLSSGRAWDLGWLLRLRRLLRKESIDVIHGHSPLVSSLCRIMLRTIPKRRRPRSIYTEHNEWPRHRPWTRRLNSWTIGLEDHVIAVSQGVRHSMPLDLPVEVLIHGIDVQAVAAERANRETVRRELGIAPDEIVVGIVANFRKEKAYDALLAAASDVTATNPAVRFVSVGQGPLEAEMRALHQDLALGDRFLILGYRDDATRVMSAFDIFTLSSLHEGLPVSLMEALALRLPVVATAVGGIPEALFGRPDAVLVEPGSAAALRDALLAMAQQDLAHLTRTASGHAQFDVRAAASVLAERYESLGGMQGLPPGG